MSTNARLFFVGSIIVTGLTVYAVNYYIDDEKKVKVFISINFTKENTLEKTSQYFS
jgi:hypothetical protein